MAIESPIKEKKYSRKFWLMMMAFYALFIIRNIFEINFPIAIFLVWVAVMAFSFDDSEIKALAVSFIPLSVGFQFKYAIFICILVLVIKYFNRIKPNGILIFGLGLMVWELLHFGIGSPSLLEFARGFAELILIMVVVCLPSKHKSSVKDLTRVLAISSTVAFTILLIMTVRGRDSSIFELMKKGFRFGVSEITEETFTFNYNANALGFMCNLAIAGLLINIYKKQANLIDYFMIAFLIFIGLLTVSRTFLLCLVITMFLYLILQKINITKKVLILLVLVVVILLALLIIIKFFPDIIDNYTDRFGEEDVTGGRSFLLGFYNDLILSSASNIFFGIGIQDIAEKALEMTGVDTFVPHNGYQQLVVAWGVPGLILMVLFVYSIIKRAKEKRKIPLIYYLPLFLLLINILAGQFVTVASKMLSLVFIFEIISNVTTGEKL